MGSLSSRSSRLAAGRAALVGVAAALLFASCTAAPPPRPAAAPPAATAAAAPPAAAAERTAVLLAINDTYRIEGLYEGSVGGMARVRTLRRELEREHPDLLFLHAGDLLFPSLLSRTFKGEQMIDALNHLDGDGEAFDDRMFVVFGNHEFEKESWDYARTFEQRLRESQFAWLGSNLTFPAGPGGEEPVRADTFVEPRVIESGGVRIGLFGLVTDLADPPYVTFVGDPIEVARRESRRLRDEEGAEVVVALTHLPIDEDQRVLDTLGDDGPDLIVGGHEHTAQDLDVGGRWIYKADADAVTASIITVTVGADKTPRIERRDLKRLAGSDPEPDPELEELAEGWLDRHAVIFCSERDRPDDCLDEVVGHTRVLLEAEETKIRAYETALGDWVADQMIDHFADRGAEVAFVNSGGLRLNRDIPADADITVRDLEELFEYSAPLKLIEIDGKTLQAVADQATRGWPGNGAWLQIGGFAFRHDPETPGSAGSVTILGPGGPRPLDPAETIVAVTVDYLVNPGIGNQDGYTMLGPEQVIAEGPDLKELVRGRLEEAGEEGIAPEEEGRICFAPAEGDPCLVSGGSVPDPPRSTE